LWQAPVFVAGIAALAAVGLARPLAAHDPQRHLARDLAGARHLLNRPDGDAEEAAALAGRALAAAQRFPDRIGEAAFLLGTAHLRLAERAGPAEAARHWQLAREHLEEAERRGVPEADGGRLAYRLGKVGFYAHDDPQRVVDRLGAGMDQADDQAEAYHLLTQAFLRLPQPDLARALWANEKLRKEVPLVGEEVLGPARLLGGELYLRLKMYERARKVLEMVGEQAPPDLLARARVLRARSFQEQGKWAEAAALYREALPDDRAQPAERARVLYDLGFCHRALDQAPEAARAWEECVGKARGPEGPAAALGLAELRLREPALEKALENLTRAVGGVRTPAQWNNPLVALLPAQALFEQAAQVFRQAGRFDLALKLTGPYERLAWPGRAQVLRAEVAAAWARARQEQARQVKSNDEQLAEEVAARNLFAQAGDAYGEAADRAGTPELKELKELKAEFLWLSAAQYVACQEYARAVEKLEQFLQAGPQVAGVAGRQGEAWYLLGEAHRRLNHKGAAAEAYRACIKFPTPFAYRARYQLALAALETGDLDEAEAALSLNLKLLRFDPDMQAQEKSLFALGGLYYQRRNYRMVVRRLEEALGRFPAHPEATRAHYELADSYRQLAAQENQNFLIGESMTADTKAHFQREHRRWLQKAADEFAELARFLETPEAQGHLSPGQQTEVPFIAARCRFNLGQYDEALRLYEKLVGRHPTGVQGLQALGGAVSCHAALGQYDKVRQRLAEMRAALAQVDEAVRRDWEVWVTEAGKPLSRP
jgi:tetratricopeptide (TPR) repeat protein